MRRCKETLLRPALALACLISAHTQAASIENRFEVVETKLLHFLATNDYQQAIEYATAQQGEFSGSGYENQLTYWLAISFARQGLLEQAQQLFDSVEPESALPLLRYEKGLLAIRQGQYAQAIELLQSFQPSGLKPQATRYYLALACFEEGRYVEALSWLQSLPNYADPQTIDLLKDGKGQYLRAASYFELQNWQSAEDTALTLIQTDSPYADEAERLLVQLRGIQRQQRPLMLGVTASVAADSNVPLLPEPETTDLRTAVLVDARYKMSAWLTPGYQFYYSTHGHYQSYNLMNNTLTLRANPIPGTERVSGSYSLAFDHLDQSWWQTRHQLTTSVALSQLRIDAEVQMQQRETGNQFGLSSMATLPFDLADNIAGQASAHIEMNLNESFAVNNVKPGAAVQLQTQIQRWLVDGGVAASYRMDAPDLPTASALAMSLNAQLARRWTPNWQTAFRAEFQSGRVDPEVLSYNRSVFTGQVTWSY